jgi:lipopolysaccharide/colanic/teichoic acid biosynthesis glycosyltransferase
MSSPILPPNELTDLPRDKWPEIDGYPADVSVRVRACAGWYLVLKVALDYSVTLLLLPFAAIALGLAALLVKLTSRGPVFYSQTRFGLNGQRYKIVKIRTMQHGYETRSGVRWAQKGDERITAVGRFLRATHIDELPQLFNVLSGEMSLVGPRPERPEVIQARGFDFLVPGYRHRLLVKPGVTGLAQVQLPADTDISSVRYKVVYDLYYIQCQSFSLDVRLLLATFFKAVGIGPRMLRWGFFLPTRRKVATLFQSCVAVVVEPGMLPSLQPA